LVPKKFWKWRKVFGKKESERMPVQKTWDHGIELKENFVPKKEKVYSLSRKERGSTSIRKRSTEEEIHSTIQISPDIASILCSQKGWKVKNGARLLLRQPMDNQKWISPTSHCGHIGQSRKKEGIYEAGSEVGI